ncbi:ABC transporter permease [Bacteroidia bacterium]|nr:ABC transporter permease [Bacteroidia bacterium]
MTMLQVRQLHIGFGGQSVVKNVSLHIPCGTTVGLVGESGSGKSLTALAVMGLLPDGASVTHGSIRFGERSLLQCSKQEWCGLRGQQIAMIFQEPMTALNPSLRCGKQVDEIILTHQKISRADAKKQTLARFAEVLLPHPDEAYKKYPHQLSGGQRQRVMIAMAIANKPRLLIADEPTTALDAVVQREILLLLQTLQRRYNMAMLLVSHDLSMIAEVCDTIAVMQNGEIVEQGDAQNVLKQPQHSYTKHLLNSRKLWFRNDSQPCNTPILEVKNVSTTFATRHNFLGKTTQTFTAVNQVSFQLFTGETLGLVGESGCGKSTLGRTIMQLLPTQSGEIIFEGKALSPRNRNAVKRYRQSVQLIFQDPYSALNPKMRIGNAIAEPMQVHGIAAGQKDAQEQAEVLLQKVGLGSEFLSRYPHQLSGGQRQRVVIARALALQPQVLICDESVSALDVCIQSQVLQLLRSLQEEMQLSYLFISHDLSVVRQISDRIMVMQHGNLVEINTAQNLFAHPKSAYTRHLIDAAY